jgi:photosystem I subunit 11
LGGCGGAAFAWFLCSTAIVAPLIKIAGGAWSVN